LILFNISEMNDTINHKKFYMTFFVGKCCENTVVRYFYRLVYDFPITPRGLIHNNKAIASNEKRDECILTDTRA